MNSPAKDVETQQDVVVNCIHVIMMDNLDNKASSGNMKTTIPLETSDVFRNIEEDVQPGEDIGYQEQ